MSRRKKKIIKRIIITGIVLYCSLGLILGSAQHRTVSDEFAESFETESLYSSAEGTERVLCIDDNTDALLWRLKVIESAQDEIIMSTFTLLDDDGGQDVMSALLAAADRGVRVRLLIDGINGGGLKLFTSDHFYALAAHENVEIRLYGIFNLIEPWTISYRMHDKYLIADDSVYILGGRNTSSLFLGDYQEKINIDRDLLVYETADDLEDTSLEQLFDYFETMWEQSCNVPLNVLSDSRLLSGAQDELREHYEEIQTTYPEAFAETDFYEATIPTNKITLLTNTQEQTNREPQMWYMLSRLMLDGEDIIIQTPYVVCSDDMYEDLTAICEDSESVIIITNAVESGANPFGCSDYLNHKEDILATGATVCEYLGDDSSHTKTILIDDRLSIVGSYNMDMRSTYLDTEMMLAVDCGELNAQLRESMAADEEKSKTVYPDGTYEYGESYTPAETSFLKKIVYGVMRVITRPIRFML